MENYKSKESNYKEKSKKTKLDEYVKDYKTLQDGEKDSNIDKINSSIEGKISAVSNILNYCNKQQFSLTYKFFVSQTGADLGGKSTLTKEDIINHYASKVYEEKKIEENKQTKLLLLINYISYQVVCSDENIISLSEKEASRFVDALRKEFNNNLGYALPFSLVEFKPTYCEEFMVNKFKCTTPILMKFNGKFE